MSNKYVAPCGRIFDLDILIDGQPAPQGTTSISSGHSTVIWPGEGHYSWDNPGQSNAHWTTHTPHGSIPGMTPPGGLD